ncbi:3-hydroxyisobutyryl-CoA hydrolase-like protein 2, mitochondrial [Ricinus communis]|uniref:3-hydroxyisobutyryl-CoA hydrolase n=1 Tax=Ricinus communis TaxID=3988 RepID=B9RNV7_RICCO|nr:3-hydroxyisobutyryl-CoA hydrolase-like protein 2, mitochondrial [Ricinus communis]EEF46875.1 Enoyl-CoA hydratase, mitochondrial precursor, putative [Ricinus communis]|eukprot:XP_002515426.1 3-hydroxyisobutyryl-CoA hydrolase-like protein 2, mitochondrial [Ricinus communis]
MQRVNQLVKVRHLVNSRIGFLSTPREFSALPNYAQNDDLQDQVLVEGRAKSRAAILNRPSSLNSLTEPMLARLKRLYESWEENPDIGFVLMKGSGRAFCSGADVVSLSELVNEGRVDECKSFFQILYKFAYLQGTYLKPHVAILDGITMGCGAGISLPGMFSIVTDKTVFAHPEAQMGFHPDAGASYYLSRLPGYLGEYLALTGDKLNGAEMIACGLATHYTLNARLALIEERLGRLVTDDRTVIETSLAQYGDLVYPDKTSVLHKIETIDKCFSHDTVEEIIDALENEAASSYDAWLKAALTKIKEASPLSLKVVLQSIREGRFQSLDKCLAREYRISLTGVSKRVSNDFCEGVRARLVDKDFAPKWDPPSLREVSEDMVDCHFSPLSELESELELPTAIRESYM